MINSSIFKAYDIRGIYPDTIDEAAVIAICRAIYTYMSRHFGKNDLMIALGCDMRVSSPSLFEAAKSTLVQCGAKVFDLGVVATPTVYFSVKQYGYDVGIQISASHNPKEYNGVKIVRRGEKGLIKIGKTTGMSDIKDMAVKQDFLPFADGGNVTVQHDVLATEIQAACNAIHTGDLSHLKIVADPANAMGILPLLELQKKLGIQIDMMNGTLDGTFPAHQADPLQHKTLASLQQRVLSTHADIGIATDGDGDRVMFVDEKGQIVPATLITALIAEEILRETPNETILVDVRYVRNVQEVVRKLGGTCEFTKVGHALITAQMNEGNAVFAGESSGHYYFRSMGGCENSMRVVLHVFAALVREKKPFSELLESVRSSIESGEVNFELAEGADVSQLTEFIISKYQSGSLNRLDGIAIDFPEWRLSIRTSNTEPLLRLNVEGNTQGIVNAKLEELTSLILATGAHKKE